MSGGISIECFKSYSYERYQGVHGSCLVEFLRLALQRQQGVHGGFLSRFSQAFSADSNSNKEYAAAVQLYDCLKAASVDRG